MRDDKANESLSTPVPKIGPAQSVATPNKRNGDLKLRRATYRVVPFLVAFLMAAGAYLTEMPGWQIPSVAALGGVGAAVCVHFFASSAKPATSKSTNSAFAFMSQNYVSHVENSRTKVHSATATSAP